MSAWLRLRAEQVVASVVSAGQALLGKNKSLVSSSRCCTADLPLSR